MRARPGRELHSAMTSPPPSRRILFVDDDPQLLSGLGKALRRHRDRWDMVFAGSGADAIEEVRRGSFDVVVSDMRMPVMDGATLLARIRELDPTTIRMILSGFSDRTSVVRALPVAHQFFEKPCDLAELTAAIGRACELRAMFHSEPLRALVARLGVLPPPPAIYHELSAMLGHASAGIPAFAAVIERDAGLHARVLQVARAVHTRTPHAIRSIDEAVSSVGVELLVALVLAAYTFELVGDRELPGFSLAEHMHHALEVARGARELGARAVADDAFVAGLVHELGRLVIATELSDDHLAIVRQCGEPGASRRAVEHGVLGTSHAELGAYLVALWGLPLRIIEAVARQDDEAAPATPVLAALRAAHAALPRPGTAAPG